MIPAGYESTKDDADQGKLGAGELKSQHTWVPCEVMACAKTFMTTTWRPSLQVDAPLFVVIVPHDPALMVLAPEFETAPVMEPEMVATDAPLTEPPLISPSSWMFEAPLRSKEAMLGAAIFSEEAPEILPLPTLLPDLMLAVEAPSTLKLNSAVFEERSKVAVEAPETCTLLTEVNPPNTWTGLAPPTVKESS